MTPLQLLVACSRLSLPWWRVVPGQCVSSAHSGSLGRALTAVSQPVQQRVRRHGVAVRRPVRNALELVVQEDELRSEPRQRRVERPAPADSEGDGTPARILVHFGEVDAVVAAAVSAAWRYALGGRRRLLCVRRPVLTSAEELILCPPPTRAQQALHRLHWRER